VKKFLIAARRIVIGLTAVVAWSVSAAQAVDIQRVVSAKGIEAWLVQDSSIPVISFKFAWRAGAAYDPKGKEGRARMLSALLDEGAGKLDSQAFQRRLEDLSVRLGFSANTDTFRGNLRTLSANRDEAFRLLALAISQPRFDAEPVERIRAQLVAGLKASQEDPDTIATRTWYRTAFPDHPYGRPNGGTVETIGAVTVDDLKDFSARYFVRKGLVIGVAGDITPQELALRLDEVFGRLPMSRPIEAVPEVQPSNAGKIIVVKRDVPQSVVLFGQAGIKRDDPDWYAAYVMNRILGGGGFSSRLMEEVREKRGLAYSVYSYLSPFEHSALYMGGVGTANARVAESLKIIRAEWQRMGEKGVTEKELASAKTYINGSFPLRLDSTRRIAGILVGVQISRLGIDYIGKRAKLIDAVTTKDIRQVAKRLLNPGALTVVVVGKPEGFEATK
jgi:zinc protease